MKKLALTLLSLTAFFTMPSFADHSQRMDIVKNIITNLDNRDAMILNYASSDLRELLEYDEQINQGDLPCASWDYVGGQDFNQKLVRSTAKVMILPNDDIKADYQVFKKQKMSNIFHFINEDGNEVIDDISMNGSSFKAELVQCLNQ